MLRQTEECLGSNIKKPTIKEKVMKIARKSIVAKEYKKMKNFLSIILQQKRPGTGISPIYFSKYLGRKAKKII